MKNTTTTTTTTTTNVNAIDLPLSFQDFRNAITDGITEFCVCNDTWYIGVPEVFDGVRKYTPYTVDSKVFQTIPPSGLKKIYDIFRQKIGQNAENNHIYRDFVSQFEKMKLEHKNTYTVVIGLNNCTKCNRILLAEIFRKIAKKMRAEGCNVKHGLIRSSFYHFCTVDNEKGNLHVHFYTTGELYNKAVKNATAEVFNFIAKFDK